MPGSRTCWKGPSEPGGCPGRGPAASAYDCLTIDLTQALHDLGEITGEDVPDEIIDEIFAQFCVGK
mgnify:CR=1 FL=1